MEHVKPILHIAAPVDTIVCKAWNEGITQPQETEHIRLEEEIRRGNFRLRELEKERVWLRKKSALMDAEVQKLKDEIKEVFIIEKPRMVRQGAYNHTDKV